MQAYTGFAAVYDTFMDNIPYEEWCEYLTGLLKEQGVTEGLLLISDVEREVSRSFSRTLVMI